jgi:hypothetical protein
MPTSYRDAVTRWGIVLLIGAPWVGCGARNDLARPDDSSTGGDRDGDGDGDGDGDADGDGGSGPVCTFDPAPLEVRPGLCQADGLECGPECGDCSGYPGTTCFEDRCYGQQGTDAPIDLHRGVFDDPEGMICTIRTSGVLERVDAMVWVGGAAEGIRLVVSLPCGDGFAPAAEHTRLASELPRWDDIEVDDRFTTFEIDPPVRVEAGQQVRIELTGVGAERYSRSGIEGIVTSDVDPDCRFWSSTYEGLPDPVDWDLVSRLYIH